MVKNSKQILLDALEHTAKLLIATGVDISVVKKLTDFIKELKKEIGK